HDCASPADRNEDERDEHAEYFVDDNRLWIDAAEIALGNVAGPRTGNEERDNGGRLEPRNAGCAQQKEEAKACDRSERAGRDGQVSDVPDGREGDGQPRHARTRRVSASRSCSARRSDAPIRTGTNPSPAGNSDARYPPVRSTARPNDTRSLMTSSADVPTTRIPAAILPMV